MEGIELKQRFPAISGKRLAVRCPYCDQIHSRALRRTLTATLILITALIVLSAPIVRASSNPEIISAAQRKYLTARPFEKEVSLAAATPKATFVPTPSSEFALRTPPSPTPLPIPTTGIIWSPSSPGAYLYAEPGRVILLEIPNGAYVHLFDEFAAYGNLPWTRVRFESYEGWVDATRVHRLRFEGETFYLVEEDGTYLYAAPQGQSLVWLSGGSPLRFQQAEDGWAAVTTLAGETGWVLLDNLLPPE